MRAVRPAISPTVNELWVEPLMSDPPRPVKRVAYVHMKRNTGTLRGHKLVQKAKSKHDHARRSVNRRAPSPESVSSHCNIECRVDSERVA